MTIENIEEDLALARTELAAATADVMAFVRAGRAFGEQWEAAIEREREAHKRMQRVLNNPLASSVDGKQQSPQPVVPRHFTPPPLMPDHGR